MRKLPAVLLPLPLGEVASRSDDGEGAERENPLSRALRRASSPKGTPYGDAAKFLVSTKAVPLRADFPQPGEDVA